MSTDLIKGWKTLEMKGIKFDPLKHIAPNELTADQTKIIDGVKKILEGNLAGDVKVFGGKVNEGELKQLQEKIKKELEGPDFKDITKKMDKVVEGWLAAWKKAMAKTCIAFLPVKDMPFAHVTFLSAPMVLEDKKGKMEFEVVDESLVYCAEIACVVNRCVLYAKVAKDKPLFAPLIGEIDLGGFKMDPNQKGPYSQNMAYILALLESLDSTSSKNNVTRYDSQYQRHGEPICDYFMKDEELCKATDKLTSSLDTKRISSGAAVCATVVPLSSFSIVMVHNEKLAYSDAFEAFLKLSASCFDSPHVRKPGANVQMAEQMTAGAPRPPGGTGVPGLMPTAPGAPPASNLPVWTEEDLAKESQTRGDPTAGMATWTEEDLAEDAKKRGLPANLEYWSEEELDKDRDKGHTVDIPEWKEEELPACPKCGYTVRKGWDTCPVCEAPLTGVEAPAKPAAKPAAKPTPQPAPQPAAKPAAKPTPQPATKPAEKPATKHANAAPKPATKPAAQPGKEEE